MSNERESTTTGGNNNSTNSTTSGNVLLSQPVVIDNGTASIKAGFAGSSKPKVVVATKVGRTKHQRVMPGGALEDLDNPTNTTTTSKQQQQHYYYCGGKLDEHRGAFYLEHPMDHGEIQSWDAMERLWEYVYSKQCLNAKQDEHPILLTEAPLNDRRNRDQIAEIFFESLRVPAIHFSPPSVLSLYASGRTTGVVLDVGEGVTHAVPVYEGFALTHSIARSNVAGRNVTQQLQLLLRRTGLCLSTTAETDLAKQMKEELCYLTPAVSSDEQAEKDARVAAKTQYKLPDGQVIHLSSERYEAPNVLFDPSLFGSEEPGAADILANAIYKSDIDLRPKLYSQIVLAGGATLTAGFGERLLAEVRRRAPAHTKLRISAPPDRIHSAYVGGSILASLATFQTLWVSRDAYEERGSAVLHERDLL